MTKTTVIEKDTVLSKSFLWDLQTTIYEHHGPQAWGKGRVPLYMTSNPFTVRQYAQVAFGLLRDCMEGKGPIQIDLSEPLYFVELGAGSARFTYLFLKQLLPMVKAIFPVELDIRYIITDMIDDNLSFIQGHSYWQELIKNRTVDFATYKLGQKKEELHLKLSGETLKKGSFTNPLILISNYLFNTVHQDMFRVTDKKLHEVRVTVSVSGYEYDSHLDPGIVPHLNCTYKASLIKDPENYYPDSPLWNKLLQIYTERYDNLTFLFPLGALQAIEYFHSMTDGHCFLMSGDQGASRESQLIKAPPPKIAKHGSFSFSVNYHLLQLYFELQGGMGFLPELAAKTYVIIAATTLGTKDKFPNLNIAYQDQLVNFEGQDYWQLVNCLESSVPTMKMDPLLLLLKLGAWDPSNFHLFFHRIRELIPTITELHRQRLVHTIHKTWEHYYPLSQEGGDFPLNLGVLLYELGHYTEAMDYYKLAIEIGRESALAYFNIGLCFQALGMKEKGEASFAKAAEFDEAMKPKTQ